MTRLARALVSQLAFISAFSIAACRTGAPAPRSDASTEQGLSALYDPSRALGPLFHAVQLSGIFPDSKTFVDARPLVAPTEIAARYASSHGAAGFDLRTFVSQQFQLPRPVGEGVAVDTSRVREDHIRALWPVLTRPPDTADALSSLITLPHESACPVGPFGSAHY